MRKWRYCSGLRGSRCDDHDRDLERLGPPASSRPEYGERPFRLRYRQCSDRYIGRIWLWITRSFARTDRVDPAERRAGQAHPPGDQRLPEEVHPRRRLWLYSWPTLRGQDEPDRSHVGPRRTHAPPWPAST